MEKIGIIGLGNMGSALFRSLSKSNNLFNGYNIFDIDISKTEEFKTLDKVKICSSIEELIKGSVFIILAVKPNIMGKVLEEIKNINIVDKKFITIAAGLQIKFYKNVLGKESNITRVMPNTPLMVGEGASGIVFDEKLDLNSKSIIKSIFSQAGIAIECEEKDMDVVTGLSGSGPAYIFMVIEALADGAVKMGLGRENSYKLAAQTVLGAAKMVLNTGEHPGQLKDKVCSPGGTTIEAVSVLERGSLRSTLIDAVGAATKKSKSFHS